MNRSLGSKVRSTVAYLAQTWRKLEGRHRFVAFSTGKDSLALAAMLYEAVGEERPPCLYSHHDLEFPEYAEYAEQMKAFGFAIEVVNPFLEYFELIDRGMGVLDAQGCLVPATANWNGAAGMAAEAWSGKSKVGSHVSRDVWKRV